CPRCARPAAPWSGAAPVPADRRAGARRAAAPGCRGETARSCALRGVRGREGTGGKRCGTCGPPDYRALPAVTPARAWSQGASTHLPGHGPTQVAIKGWLSLCRTGAYSLPAPGILLARGAGPTTGTRCGDPFLPM